MPLSYQEIKTMLTGPGRPFEIEEITINGSTIRNWKNAPTSIPQVLLQSKKFADQDYIVYQGERLSFSQHFAKVAALANQLVTQFGINKGDRVAIALRNYPEWSIAFWAITAAGAIAVPLNAWWTGDELVYGLNDSGARLIFVDPQRPQRLQPLRNKLSSVKRFIMVRGERVPDAIALEDLLSDVSSDMPLPSIDIQPDDPATLFYTSGTTGNPKGTLGSHRNFCSVAISMPYTGLANMLRMGMSLEEVAKLQDQMKPIYLLTLPLFHVSGCHSVLLGALSTGGKIVMMHKWDPEEAINLIEHEKVSLFSAVPTMVMQLTQLPNIIKRNLSSVKNIGYGGAPTAPELLRRVRDILPFAQIGNGWGITETSSLITTFGGPDYAQNPESAGPPIPVCEVKAVDEKGHEVPTGELGELWVKGPNVVKEYWNRPEASAESFTDGWFHTGDIGKIDADGLVYIVDRLKDMIIRGGENIYCAEVEAAALEHPAVQGACVFGLPHEVLGEEVACVIQTAQDKEINSETLKEHLLSRLAKYKVPSHIWIQKDPLPLGPTGKIQKKELKQYYQAKI